jgi:hypothetical protein
MEDDEFNIYLEEADITTIHESYQFLIKVPIMSFYPNFISSLSWLIQMKFG